MSPLTQNLTHKRTIFDTSKLARAALLAAILGGMGGGFLDEALAAQYQLESVDYNPGTQTLLLKSNGPVQTVVNTVNIGHSKRIIMDMNNAEIGQSVPRDSILLQQLSSKWAAVKSISINQFGGTEPVVRVLLDVEGINYVTQVLNNRTPLVQLKISPLAQTVPVAPAPRPIAATLQPSLPANPSTSTISGTSNAVTVQELKKTLATASQKYDQLSQENHALKTQLEAANKKQQAPDPNAEAEIHRLREANMSLQTQLGKMSDERKQAQAPGKASLSQLEKENAHLKAQLAAAQKSAPLKILPTPITDPQLIEMKKQVDNAKAALNRSITTINQQNKEITTLRDQLDQLKGGIDASSKEQLTTLNARLDAKNAENKTLGDQVNSLTQQLKAANANPAKTRQLQEQLEQKDNQVITLSQQVTQKDTQLTALHQQLATQQTQLQTLQAAPGETEALKHQLAQLETQYKNTIAESNKKIADAHAANSKVNDLTLQIGMLQDQLKESQTKYQKTINDFNNAQTTVERQKQEQKNLAQLQKRESDLTALKNENAQLQNKLKQALADSARKQDAKNTTELQKRDSEITALKADNAHLQDKLNQLSAETVQTQELKNSEKKDLAQIAMLKTDNSQLQNHLLQLSSDLERLKKQQAESADNPRQDTKLAKENKRLQKLVDLMKRDNELMASDKDNKRQTLEAKVATLQNENNALAASLKNMHAPDTSTGTIQIQQLQSELKSLQGNNETLQAELKQARLAAEKQPTPQETKITSKTDSASALHQQVHTLQNQLADMKKDKENLMAINQSLFTEISTLKKNSDGKSRAVALTTPSPESEKQIAALNNQISDLTGQVENLQTTKKDLESRLAKQPAAPAATSSTQSGAELNATRKQLAEMEGRYKKILGDYDRLQRQKGGKSNDKDASKDAGKDSRAELASLKAQIQELSTQNETLQATLKHQSAQLAASTAPIAKSTGTSATAPTSSKITPEIAAQAEKHFQLGQDAENNNQKDLALEEYQRALKLDEDNSKYVYGVALALAQRQQYSASIRMLQDYIDSHPYQADGFNHLGKVYLLSGQPEEAKQAFAKAIPVNSLNNYASALKRLGKLSEAERVFKTAVELSPNDSELLFNLGNIYNSANNLQEAKESYTQALSLNPRFAEAHYNLGLVYSKMGDKQSAITHLEKFLELSPKASNADVIRNYVKKLKS